MPDLVHSFTHNFTLSSVTPSCYHWDSYLKCSKAGVMWLYIHLTTFPFITLRRTHAADVVVLLMKPGVSPQPFHRHLYPLFTLTYLYLQFTVIVLCVYHPALDSHCCVFGMLLLNAAPWSWRNDISLYTLYRGMIINSCLIDLHTLVWQTLLSNVLEPVVGSELGVLFAWASSSPSIFN